MSTSYYPELDSEDLLDLRMACGEAISLWHRNARMAKEEGDSEKADTCNRIGAKYHQLWEKFHDIEASANGEPLWRELHPRKETENV